ncbi:MAG TPA: SSI family serine proteinase inhibitor, partial [Thermopolyspora sp.]
WLLTCTPDGGTHSDAKAACDQLRAVDGNLETIRDRPSACARIYDPQQVEITGTWNGQAVYFTDSYPNGYCMASVAAPIIPGNLPGTSADSGDAVSLANADATQQPDSVTSSGQMVGQQEVPEQASASIQEQAQAPVQGQTTAQAQAPVQEQEAAQAQAPMQEQTAAQAQAPMQEQEAAQAQAAVQEQEVAQQLADAQQQLMSQQTATSQERSPSQAQGTLSASNVVR